MPSEQLSKTPHAATASVASTALNLCAVISGALLIASSCIAAPLSAQSGVSLGLCYGAGCDTKQHIMVDSVRGAGGDSIRTIIARDLDNSDRFLVLQPAGTPPVTGAPLNYPLFASLGVNGVIEASVLPSGWLHMELHDVGLKTGQAKTGFSAAGNTGQPRLAHGTAWRVRRD